MPVTKEEFVTHLLEQKDALYAAYLSQQDAPSLLDKVEADIGETTAPSVDPLTDAQVKDSVDKLAKDTKIEQIALTGIGIILTIAKVAMKS